jgi:hypothetical protein
MTRRRGDAGTRRGRKYEGESGGVGEWGKRKDDAVTRGRGEREESKIGLFSPVACDGGRAGEKARTRAQKIKGI